MRENLTGWFFHFLKERPGSEERSQKEEDTAGFWRKTDRRFTQKNSVTMEGFTFLEAVIWLRSWFPCSVIWDSGVWSWMIGKNKKEFTIPAGTTAKIKYYKPDGKFVLNNATINGNVITVTYTEQMLAVSGTGRGEIVLYNGTAVLRSATYYTKITPTVYKENGLISDNEFLDMAESIIAMNKQIDKAINATKSAEQAATDANTAAAAANSAAKAGNAAATAGNNAAKAANDAAEAANAAANRVDKTKKDATAAAGAANSAANAANEAATAANNAAKAGNAAAAAGNSAAKAANDAAAAANEAKANTVTATQNAQTATSEANTKAAAANNAAAAANKAAAACENMAKGINSMTDGTTGITYTIGINGGMVSLESV